MGQMYENGWGGIAVNKDQARYYYRQAAEVGIPGAKEKLEHLQ
jgi:TPR repeat protein